MFLPFAEELSPHLKLKPRGWHIDIPFESREKKYGAVTKEQRLKIDNLMLVCSANSSRFESQKTAVE